MEVELRLALDPAAAAALRRHPLLARHATAAPRTQRLTTTYFDTQDLFFWQHGAALRVRRAGRRWIQTLKGGGQVAAGLHERDEWEVGVPGPVADLAALQAAVGDHPEWAGLLVAAMSAGPLLPIFTTTFRRTTWQLQPAPGTAFEVMLDRGTVGPDGAALPICEVELELGKGDPAALFDFALALQETLPLRVSNVSKAERGFALRTPSPAPVATATALRLTARAHLGLGRQVILANCLAQVQGNEAGVIDGIDPESVHQMRVGLRRLRFAVRLFDPFMSCPPTLQAELKWLAAELGAARDWEVLAGTTLVELERRCPEARGLAALREAAQTRARDVREEAAAAVASPRYARLLLDLGRWLLCGRPGALPQAGPAATPASDQPSAPPTQLALRLDKIAARLQKRLHRRLGKRGAQLAEATPEVRHEVRIAAKRVRYAAEFFASLYPQRQVRPYLRTVMDLQDVLGTMNDAAVASGLVGQLASADPGLAESAAYVSGYLAAGTRCAARGLKSRWRRFGQSAPPRRK